MAEVKTVKEYEEVPENGEAKAVKDTNLTLEDFKKMLKGKIDEGIRYIYDNPVKILAIGSTILMGYNKFVKPVTSKIDEIKHDRTYYDRYGSQHVYELKRKMTNRELYECDDYVRAGGNAYEWLVQHNLARR